jgi:hypothetical protein
MNESAPLAGLFLGLWAVMQIEDRVGRWVREWRERRAPTPMEQLKDEYAADPAMTEEELSERVDDLLEPDDRDTRERVEEVGGVGPAVAGEVAEHFPSLEHVRQADRDELQAVPHVGPDRAESIHRHFS